jgi:hypothetical protein
MSFSILLKASIDCIPANISFDLRTDGVLSSTGLNEAEASYTLPEKWLKRKATRQVIIIRAIYKYFSEATFRIKYLRGAIDESGSIVFNIVLKFIES